MILNISIRVWVRRATDLNLNCCQHLDWLSINSSKCVWKERKSHFFVFVCFDLVHLTTSIWKRFVECKILWAWEWSCMGLGDHTMCWLSSGVIQLNRRRGGEWHIIQEAASIGEVRRFSLMFSHVLKLYNNLSNIFIHIAKNLEYF